MIGLNHQALKSSLAASGNSGLVIDIDETLSATNVTWFQRCVDLFGNPEGLTVSELISKYHLAQFNPAWQSDEAKAWMHRQRNSPEAQDNLPLIPGAVQGVRNLAKITSVVAYLTVRPESVNNNTIKWLMKNDFPKLPVVAKPDSVPFEEGNQWKARTLHDLWPEVVGIVDDNPKLPTFAGAGYPGDIYLFGRGEVESGYEWAIPCKTWQCVVKRIEEGVNRN
mmetsp:Transcript_65462/g.77486  ORF Transcript_65462/g.77486 Transcript_65462/m.77486 type:complete len:223 (+) Transcript_65462:38-706(+)|eukprot:CAMPEP_0172510372 /NCGR_PEP_ID=MMETSP1066-20121228/227944_1 /TAXON_ID=671091 /ORGANISM="Coscinodiscus wailesii, Strain CCMP2513" /LENGTH=222 /DNA_ID=CAMNT_0013289295 /DNA_START=36 /DNA_END=704 /DNA_ORIENTATION=-